MSFFPRTPDSKGRQKNSCVKDQELFGNEIRSAIFHIYIFPMLKNKSYSYPLSNKHENNKIWL